MASYVETPCRTLTAGGAIGQYLRVKISSDVLAVAGAGATDDTVEIGTVERAALAAGDEVPVRLRNASGTVKVVAAEAIAAGAAVYGAANGKVADTVSGGQIGVAITAAGADGEVIEIVRFSIGAAPA